MKRRIGSDYECVYSYWPNGEMYTEVWKDLTTGLISECRTYTENGELAESTQTRRDSSGDIVHEYVQTFWHTENEVVEEHGRLLKITEFWNDLIDKSASSYRMVVTSEKKGELLCERIDTADDCVSVWYGEHEKLGTVVNRVENIDFVIHLVYGEDGIVALNVTDERLVSNPQKLIYLKETCQVRELMKDWKKVIEYVEKKKYKKVELKRHWYDFRDKKFVEKIEEISKRSVMLESIDLEKIEFVKGTTIWA